MNTTLSNGLNTSASKRARSTDSRTSVSSVPVRKASKAEEEEEVQDDTSIPAFLCQSQAEIHTKFEEIEWLQSLRINQGRTDPSSNWMQDKTLEVKSRNRYFNVQPWENSRVRLKVAEGESDYINASPISLRDPRTGAETTYIATQGPKQNGVSHFWQMIWQETTDIAVIVMLTQIAEAGKEKCFQYFPLDAEARSFEMESTDSANVVQGDVTLVEDTFDQISRTTIRKLLLTVGEETRTVWHLLFGGWPDFAVPENEDRDALLELLEVSAHKNTVSENPRIVHCSAGVGRSGTFIALEYLLAQLRSGALAEAEVGEDMIFNVVNRLREQRMTMVQSEAQYQFLYEVIRERYKEQRAATRASTGNGKPSFDSRESTAPNTPGNT